VFEFFFVDVDCDGWILSVCVFLFPGIKYEMGIIITGDAGAEEVLKSSGVVEVEVAHDDGLDVSDIVAGGFDGIGELHLLGVDSAREQIGQWRTPFLCLC
jgi:hypothetical protein